MKYRLIATVVLIAALAALGLSLEQSPSTVTAPASSGSDDASMKTLKIE